MAPINQYSNANGAHSTQEKNRKRQQRPQGEHQEHKKDQAATGRKGFQPYHATRVPKGANLEQSYSTQAEEVTTMMLRNIPNKYTQSALIQELDEGGFAGTYNFFYLPMDAHNHSNVGYAFVNFLNPPDAMRCFQYFSDYRFKRFHSRKIGMVSPANIQGLENNLRHFQHRAVTQARNGQYRPVILMGGQRMDLDEALANLDQFKGNKSDSIQAPIAAEAKIDLPWDSDADLQDWRHKIGQPEPRFQSAPQTDVYNRLQASPAQSGMEHSLYSQMQFRDSLQSVLQQLATTLNHYEEQGTATPPMRFGPLGSGYPQYGIGADQPRADEPFYIRPRALGGTPPEVLTPPMAPPPGLEDVADWGGSGLALPKDLLSRKSPSHNLFGKGTGMDSIPSIDTNFPTPRTNVNLLAGCYGSERSEAVERVTDNNWPYSNQ